MKKKRSYPFGYTIRNGRLRIDETEAAAVCRIFEEYRNGASIAKIASMMTGLGIPYSENRKEWNKNIVARILGDQRYIGANGFETIVDPQIFYEITQTKVNRNTRRDIDKNPSLELFRKKVVCSRCGSRMVRVIDDRKKNPVIWRCDSHLCNARVAVLDGVLEKRIVTRMNLIIDNLDLLDDAVENDAHGMEVEQRSKITEELSRMCDSGHYSDEQLLTIILENAQNRYALCTDDKGGVVTAERDAYSNAEPSENINIELFRRTVSNILLNSDGSVQLQLMSGKTI